MTKKIKDELSPLLVDAEEITFLLLYGLRNDKAFPNGNDFKEIKKLKKIILRIEEKTKKCNSNERLS
jgi:hypothetical protein